MWGGDEYEMLESGENIGIYLKRHSPAEVLHTIAKVIKVREIEDDIISFPRKS